MRSSRSRRDERIALWACAALGVVAAVIGTVPAAAVSSRAVLPKPAEVADRAARWYEQMSDMGALAAGVTPADARPVGGRYGNRIQPPLSEQLGSADTVVNGMSAAATQSETSLAANTDGSVLIAGYNDARGFPDPASADQNTLSLSGIARSTDGGTNWTPLPIGPNSLPVLPTVTNGSVFGDPSVVWDAVHHVFVYASIYVRPSDRLQGMSVSVSSSDGTSWSNPVEVSGTFVSTHSADKEWLAVNRLTGRIILTWTDFASTSTLIKSAYSDDDGTTWSAVSTLVSVSGSSFVQASQPVFLPAATNAASSVYVVWRNGTSSDRNIAAVRSTDGGASWSAPVNIDSNSFPVEDQILGVDRVNTSPSIVVDEASGKVYVVYQRNNSKGTGDIALRTWLGAPAAAAPVLLDADPGNDRAQFYPWVTVDQSNSNVHVGWLDEGYAASGDLLEVMHTESTNDGRTWSPPTPLNDRAFHAGYGNDTSQPNLGDYNGAIASGGTLRTLWGGTAVQPEFDEGLPALALVSPDVYYATRSDAETTVPLRPAEPTLTDTGATTPNGHLDPGESADISVPLTNYVANATVGAATITGISATLTSNTPGVTVTSATSSYPNIATLATQSNTTPFTISTADTFLAGTPIDLTLDVTSDQGTTSLALRFETGTPTTGSTLINENFESATVPTLPAGWTASTGGGTADPWVLNSSFTGSKAAFHGEGTATEWMRLFSPTVSMPTPGVPTYVTLDFDIKYNLEDEPSQDVLAYDGLTVRLTDMNGNTPIRSVLAEAFAQSIKTDSIDGFPKHLPRNNSANYFQDMAVWSGDSAGVIHVSMRFPGTGLAGRTVQLRFEYTQDSVGLCAAPPCGVAIDNVVLAQVPVAAQTTTILTSTPASPIKAGQSVTLTAHVPSPATGSVDFFDNGNPLDSDVPVSAGTATSSPFAPSTGHAYTAVYTSDTAGYVGSTSAPLSFVIDGTAPSVTLKTPTAAFTLKSSTNVTWSGSDVGTGIASYVLQTRKAPWNGSFGAWSSSAQGTNTSRSVSLPVGYTYCFRVVATDHVGNSTTSATRCTARPLDDRALTPSTGWTRRTGSAYYLGTYTVTTHQNATLTRSGAQFDRVGILATRCATCGTVGIYSGTTLLGKINLAHSTTQHQVLLILPKLASVRTATIKIKVLSSGKTVQIDGLAVSRA
jgi:hypothetical protein